MSKERLFRKDDGGATAVSFALLAPLFLGAFVATAEVGAWHHAKASLQRTSDMAAVAAMRDYRINGREDALATVVRGDARDNGFAARDGGIGIAFPSLDPSLSHRDAIDVQMHRTLPLAFAKVFLPDGVRVGVRSTAVIGSFDTACILALHPTAHRSLELSGSTAIDLHGCSAHANSSASGALYLGGSASLRASCLSTVGGMSGDPSRYALTECEAPETGTLDVRDPLRHIAMPEAMAAMPCFRAPRIKAKSGAPTLLPAGRYCNQAINVSGEVELEPGGTYVFDNSRLSLGNSGSRLRGDGVTLLFANGGVFDGSNGGVMQLSAQSEGPYAGVLIYVDRDTTPAKTSVKINGNAQTTLDGTLYMPTVDLTFNGGSATASDCLQIVAQRITFTGNSALRNTGCPLKLSGGSGGAVILVR